MWNRRSFLGSVVASVLGLVGMRAEAKPKKDLPRDWVEAQIDRGLLEGVTYSKYEIAPDGLSMKWAALRVGQAPNISIPRGAGLLCTSHDWHSYPTYLDQNNRPIYLCKGIVRYQKVYG